MKTWKKWKQRCHWYIMTPTPRLHAHICWKFGFLGGPTQPLPIYWKGCFVTPPKKTSRCAAKKSFLWWKKHQKSLLLHYFLCLVLPGRDDFPSLNLTAISHLKIDRSRLPQKDGRMAVSQPSIFKDVPVSFSVKSWNTKNIPWNSWKLIWLPNKSLNQSHVKPW